MTREFNTTGKEQYAQGPAQTKPQMTEKEYAELEKQKEENMKEQMVYMGKEIEFMRLKKEYQELQVTIYETSFMLGSISASQVPGILGLELMRRDIESQMWLHQFKQGQEQAKKEQESKAQSAMQEAGTATSTIITDGQVK